MRFASSVIVTALILGSASVALADPVGTVFTYEGYLEHEGIPADGLYDWVFYLLDGEQGTTIGGPIYHQDVLMEDGRFVLDLDFGEVFTGGEAWLFTQVREDGDGPYTLIQPNQRIYATPYAVNADRVGGLTVDEIQLSGIPNPLVLGGENAITIDGNTSLAQADAVGVRGRATAFNSATYGVLGLNQSQHLESAGVAGIGFARGVYGYAYDQFSTTYAVYGRCDSPVGYCGYFEGGVNYFEGKVGIGTLGPTTPLAVRAPSGVTNVGITQADLGDGHAMELTTSDENTLQRTRLLLGGGSNDAIAFYRGNRGAEVVSMMLDHDGDVGIGTSTPGSKLHVMGTTRTSVLQIDGGSDLSEGFDVAGPAEPGTVVVIDPERPGGLRGATRAYDRRVAGVVSGAGGVNTGLLMGQETSLAAGEVPVALTGRVYCKADASHGPIEPGNLLVTSTTPGHAMRMRDAARAQGAVLGKAMTALETGRGLVLVLVALQ